MAGLVRQINVKKRNGRNWVWIAIAVLPIATQVLDRRLIVAHNVDRIDDMVAFKGTAHQKHVIFVIIDQQYGLDQCIHDRLVNYRLVIPDYTAPVPDSISIR